MIVTDDDDVVVVVVVVSGRNGYPGPFQYPLPGYPATTRVPGSLSVPGFYMWKTTKYV